MAPEKPASGIRDAVDPGRPLVLLVGAERPTTARLEDRLVRRGYSTLVHRRASDVLAAVRAFSVSLVIVALPIAEASSRGLLRDLKDTAAGLPIVVLGTDHELRGPEDTFDFGVWEHLLETDTHEDDILSVIGVALGSRRQDEHLRYLQSRDAAEAAFRAVLGECPAMQRVRAFIEQVCRRTARGGVPPIRIAGETGTGKGLVAKALHYNSARRHQPFVDVNCAALPPSLMEAELFGHEKGAFTDARTTRRGLFETAHQGTLFLDEIGCMPPDLQAKLLTAIEDKQIRRIGGRTNIHVDVQIIAATHHDLEALVASGRFRDDLFHRLNVLTVTLPPLRERENDKILLAEEFVARACAEYGMPRRRISDAARKTILAYAWPGNVRELRNQLERVVLLENDDVIRAEHFDKPAAASGVQLTHKSGTLQVTLPAEGISLEELDRVVIETALARHDGNVSRTARYLGVSRQKLIYRMKKHELRSNKR